MQNIKINVFEPHGWVELEQQCGTDLDVVNCAKVSFAKHSEEFGTHERGVLNFLMKERHGTPFEHNFFKFHVRAPLFVIREWQRHRVGCSYNEESGRYVELRPDFYIPNHARVQKGKPGKYKFEQGSFDQGLAITTETADNAKDSYDRYTELLQLGVAKEQARLVLPLTLYSEFYFSCNARSLMNFISLRMSEQAMFEIREYAKALYTLFSWQMTETAQAFADFNYIAP